MSKEQRRLICEGWIEPGVEAIESEYPSLVMQPEVICVRQGQKAYFFVGGPTQLHESFEDGVQIVESIDKLDIVEAEDGTKTVPNGDWTFEGVFQRCGVKNANGRTYSRKLWERVLNENSPAITAIRDRSMVGHLEHPKDGRTDGTLGAILTSEAALKQDGTVWGKGKILDTPHGRILKTYTMEGVRWGVSSRGSGIIRPDGAVDENDYQLVAWDAVMRPSVPGAFPKVADSSQPKESVEESHEDIERTLENAVTDYDRKQSTRRGYNHYALGHYLGAVKETMKAVKGGADIHSAIADHFNDRLRDHLHKAVASKHGIAHESVDRVNEGLTSDTASRWERVKKGEVVPMGDHHLDELSAHFKDQDSDEATHFFNQTASAPNPDKVMGKAIRTGYQRDLTPTDRRYIVWSGRHHQSSPGYDPLGNKVPTESLDSLPLPRLLEAIERLSVNESIDHQQLRTFLKYFQNLNRNIADGAITPVKAAPVLGKLTALISESLPDGLTEAQKASMRDAHKTALAAVQRAMGPHYDRTKNHQGYAGDRIATIYAQPTSSAESVHAVMSRGGWVGKNSDSGLLYGTATPFTHPSHPNTNVVHYHKGTEPGGRVSFLVVNTGRRYGESTDRALTAPELTEAIDALPTGEDFTLNESSEINNASLRRYINYFNGLNFHAGMGAISPQEAAAAHAKLAPMIARRLPDAWMVQERQVNEVWHEGDRGFHAMRKSHGDYTVAPLSVVHRGRRDEPTYTHHLFYTPRDANGDRIERERKMVDRYASLEDAKAGAWKHHNKQRMMFPYTDRNESEESLSPTIHEDQYSPETMSLAQLAESQTQGAGIRRNAFGRIASKLQEIVRHRNAGLQEAQGELSQTRGQLDEQVRQGEDSRRQLQERVAYLEGELEKSKSTLQSAQTFIAESTSHVRANGPVVERIDAVIEERPELGQYREVLESAQTIERVDALVERLGAAAPQPRTETVPPEERRTMPRGNVISEADVSPRITKSKADVPIGVQRLGIILDRLKPQQK